MKLLEDVRTEDDAVDCAVCNCWIGRETRLQRRRHEIFGQGGIRSKLSRQVDNQVGSGVLNLMDVVGLGGQMLWLIFTFSTGN